METYSLSEMKLGWFIGDFEPAALQTKDFEVAIKHYKAGNREEAHFHKEAIEITVIISGRVRMNGSLYGSGDIVLMQKNQSTDFIAEIDTVTCVVKTPSVPGDKHLASKKNET